MPPSKHTGPTKLEGSVTKIGKPVPKAIIDTHTASVGVPPQPAHDPRAELEELRKQVSTLQQQISGAADAVRGGVREAGRQTEATVKLYPVSALIAVAAVAGTFAFALAGRRATPPRSRYDTALDGVRDLYGRARDRF